MLNPGFHVNGARRVDDDDDIVGCTETRVIITGKSLFSPKGHRLANLLGDGENEIISTLPSGDIVPVSDVAIDGDVLFTGIRGDKDDRDVLVDGQGRSAIEVVVFKEPRELSSIFERLLLQSLERGDEVGKVGSSRAPTWQDGHQAGNTYQPRPSRIITT